MYGFGMKRNLSSIKKSPQSSTIHIEHWNILMEVHTKYYENKMKQLKL